MDTNEFFPITPAGSRRHAVPRRIQHVCDRCPVREQCLRHALANGEEGIWGGTTETQRHAIMRRIRRARCPTCGSSHLLTRGLHQTCSGCATSWIATTTPTRSRNARRPNLGINRHYDHSTRAAAVAAVLTPQPDGQRPSIASVAARMGVNRESLRQWVLHASTQRATTAHHDADTAAPD